MLPPSAEVRAKPSPGTATALLTLSLRGSGVRSSVLRFRSTVCGDGLFSTVVGIAPAGGPGRGGNLISYDLSVYTDYMSRDLDANEVAGALRVSLGLLVRRLRQAKSDGDLTLPESTALARLDRGGPTTSAALAKLEQISPQSMGATLSGLENRGLIERRPDPEDGRRILMSLTDAGVQVLRNRRDAGTEHLARAVSSEFSGAELEQLMVAAQLIERLAQNL